MDKREMIEKALGRYLEHPEFESQYDFQPYTLTTIDLNALAKQAIVIECEVEHKEDLGNELGHHGTPGKSIAIVLPLEEK